MSEDLGLFGVDEGTLLQGIRVAGLQSAGDVAPHVRSILEQGGLLDESGLSGAGRSLYQTAWVLRRSKDAGALLGQALRSLLPLQVLEQELRGFGAVPEEGVLDLLRLHRAVPPDLTIERARPVFKWMNAAGVLVYSQKMKTVRVLAPATEAALAGETEVLAAMISPRTPYSNVVRTRRLIRQLAGVVTWADPHFGARALEELVTELDPEQVTEVRVLSGDATSVLTPKSLKDFCRFKDELSHKGVVAEWRVDPNRDWHDRWLIARNGVWNLPPVNSLFQNQYAEILPTDSRPPIEEWWARSSER